MHIHLPKPLHGWKEFANEIFVIVIGVLIALAFEQGVEWLHWQHKVEDGEERLKTEVGVIYAFAAEDLAAEPCMLAQLEMLRQHVLESGPTMQPVPLYVEKKRRFVIRVPARITSSAVWEGLITDGTAAHLDKGVQQQLGQFYTQLSNITRYNAATGAFLRKALAEEEGRIGQRAINDELVMARAARIGLEPSPERVDAQLEEYALRGGTLSFCKAHGYPIADWKTLRGEARERLSNIRF
jgi:hypothetical protein